MGFRDFIKYFGLIEICHLPPERHHHHHHHSSRGDSISSTSSTDRSLLQVFTGSWRVGTSAGGSGRNGEIGTR